MKLSNKILLGFFGFIFLYLTAAFAELRISGTPNAIDDDNSIAETVDITGVTHLVFTDVDKQVHVIGSDVARLEVRSFAGDLLSTLTYKVSGDTLTLSDLPSEGRKTMKISVFVPKTTLTGITVNSSVAIVRGLESGNLNLSQRSGSIWMTESSIGKMEVDLTDSYLEISASNMDTVSAQIATSDVRLYAPVGVLQGEMKNGAFLRLTDAEEIQLKKDAGSRLTIFQ